MLHPQAFLLEECENVGRLLRNTLRYAYSSKSSGNVYAECLSRLRLIRSRVLATSEGDGERLNELANQLSQLSQLIGRVERSHIEEFSWPVAEAIQNLAGDVCGVSENADQDSQDNGPLFFISAEDELFSYEIDTERDNPGLIARPLFNIIFPRSLKNFVLLHPILAHEIGHAAYAIPDLGAELQDEVVDTLIEDSPLKDREAFADWVSKSGRSLPDEELDYALLLWPEELYCDLFGLLLLGPSFIAANCTLLHPFGPDSLSDSHPASLTRYWMKQVAVEFLGWRHVARGTGSRFKQPVEQYFSSLSDLASGVPRKLRLLRTARIREAVESLARILGRMGDALFQMPSAASLSAMVDRLLLARPPVESNVSSRLALTNEDVDFRSILFAGWLAWNSDKRTDPALSFLNLNLLCDRGVLQQSAVDRWSEKKQAGIG